MQHPGKPTSTGFDNTPSTISAEDRPIELFRRSSTRPTENPHLTVRTDLPDEEQIVQRESIEQLRAAARAFIARYRREFGNHISSDCAAELFPGYNASEATRAKFRRAVSPAAAWVAERAFQQRLAEPDNHTPVVFTAGGTASGKSTLAKNDATKAIVYDSTLSEYASAKRRIQQALDSRRNVRVVYIYRDPLDAYAASLRRAEQEGAGRNIRPVVHAMTHKGAAETVRQLVDEFNDKIRFRFFHNTGTPGGFSERTIEVTTKQDHTGLRKRIEELDTRLRRNYLGRTG